MPQQLLPFTPFNLPSHLWPKVGGHDTKKGGQKAAGNCSVMWQFKLAFRRGLGQRAMAASSHDPHVKLYDSARRSGRAC